MKGISMDEITLDELKQEAKDLGIEFSANISKAKLQDKINAYYAGEETSGKEVIEAASKSVEQAPQGESVSVLSAVAKMKADANKTRVVTIIDNDQRVNGQTTTCIVNCSNMYFDLNTVILPLNTSVEVRQGHINVLKELQIPQHVKDTKSGLSTVRLVPRYTISYENVE